MNFSALAKKLCATLAIAGLFVFDTAPVTAAPINLVKNGGFELSTGTGQIGYNTTVQDWYSPGGYAGYNFLFEQGTADTTGAHSWFDGPGSMPMALWGANNGGANALAASKNGGSFVANDGAYGVVPIAQMITGLIVGQTYRLTFEWAAAQQYGFSGETSEAWFVQFGDQKAQTEIYKNANHSSSEWMDAAFTFTASATSELLSFLALGTPEGFPPMSLLDGVSLVAFNSPLAIGEVPEPASWLLVMAGLGGLFMVARRRRAA